MRSILGFLRSFVPAGLNADDASTIVARNIRNNYRLPQAVVTISRKFYLIFFEILTFLGCFFFFQFCLSPGVYKTFFYGLRALGKPGFYGGTCIKGVF